MSIVPKTREEKRRRQFVFATHNASIPVLGYAELIVGLSARNSGGQTDGALAAKHMGALDARVVRELVEEVLEGGRRAFELPEERAAYAGSSGMDPSGKERITHGERTRDHSRAPKARAEARITARRASRTAAIVSPTPPRMTGTTLFVVTVRLTAFPSIHLVAESAAW